MVSNEDREAARRSAYNEINWDNMISVGLPDHNGSRVINLRSEQIIRDATVALVSLGWGPKPTVTLDQLGEIIDGYSHACPHCPDEAAPEWVVLRDQVTDIVRECGIEVTS